MQKKWKRAYDGPPAEVDDPPETPPEGENDALPPPTPSLSLDALPEQLRGLPENQIKFTLNQMVTSLAESNRRNKEYEDRLRDMNNKPADSPPPNKHEGKSMEELILEDPEAAIEEYLQKKGYINRFNDIDSRVGDTVFDSVARQIDDFPEHEDEVRELLKASQSPMTKQNIMGAYTMVVGQKTLEEKRRTRQKATNLETPKPDPDVSKTKTKLTPLQQEIRSGMGMSEEDYIKWNDNSESHIKVPT